MKKFLSVFVSVLFACALPLTLAGCSESAETVVLRVCSWEEYIDLGDWDEGEIIDLESGDIFGKNSMVDDFTEWFNSKYDFKVKVEYSTFGTNEDLYNRLSLGDEYDLVCPSDYMIMKLLAEEKIQKYSPRFFEENDENHYDNFVSPYIKNMFENYGWDEYAACYMCTIPKRLRIPQTFRPGRFFQTKTIKDRLQSRTTCAMRISLRSE